MTGVGNGTSLLVWSSGRNGGGMHWDSLSTLLIVLPIVGFLRHVYDRGGIEHLIAVLRAFGFRDR